MTELAEHDRVASLIYLALSENRTADALDLAEAHWPVLISHNVAVLRAVADRLSPAELAAKPTWDRIRRYLGFMLLDPSVRPAAYVDAPLPHPPRSLADTLLTLTTRSMAARSSGRFGEAVQLARTALQRLDEARESEQEALRHRLPDGYLQWGLAFEFAALEAEALTALERAYELGVAFENTRAATGAAGEIAWINTLAGRGPEADLWAARARKIAEASRSPLAWRRTDVLAAAVRLADQLQPDAALELLATRSTASVDEHKLTALAQSVIFRMSAGRSTPTLLLSELRAAQASSAPLFAEPNQNVIAFAYIEALMHLYGNHPDRAIELLTKFQGIQGGGSYLGVRAAAELAVGADAAAERCADIVISDYAQWPRQLVPALLVKAALALQSGDSASAVALFTDACRLAVDNRLVSSLLVIPHADFAQLLTLAGERLVEPELDTLARMPLMFAPPRRRAVNLSPRELGVLRELSRGGTLAEVAGRLHLSVNTLKVHNHAIYKKLAVDGRDQAVAAARDRGLI